MNNSAVNLHQMLIPYDASREADHAFGSKAVIYLHGIGGSLAVWYFSYMLPLYGKLHQLAYDMRGHGSSDYPQSGYAVSDHSADLYRLASSSAVAQQQQCFIGYSYGGCVVLDYAARYAKQSDKVIILDAPAVERIDQQVIDELRELAQAMRGNVVAPTGYLAAEFQAAMGEFDPQERRVSRYAQKLEALLNTAFPQQCIHNASPSIQQLSNISCEVLLIYATHADCLVNAEHIKAHVPRCELLELDAQHDLISTHSDDIRDAMLGFIH